MTHFLQACRFALLLTTFLTWPAEIATGQATRPATQPASGPVIAPVSSRLRITFGGSDAGHASFERHADGTFTASSEMTIGTLKLAERVTGRYEEAANVPGT